MFVTVKDLIAILQTHHPERVVFMQQDAYGNGITKPFEKIFTASFNPTTLEVGMEAAALTDHAKTLGFSQKDVVNGLPALVLVPAPTEIKEDENSV